MLHKMTRSKFTVTLKNVQGFWRLWVPWSALSPGSPGAAGATGPLVPLGPLEHLGPTPLGSPVAPGALKTSRGYRSSRVPRAS